MGPDFIIAWDDALVERYPRCIICLAPARYIDTALVNAIVVAVSRCRRCVEKDKD